MNKRGQFFFVAAIIIAGILIGLTTVVNQAVTSQEETGFYDLGEEIGFETKKVIDYGVYKDQDISVLTEGFLEDYADYIASEEVIFLIGGRTGVKALYFNSSRQVGSVGISTGGSVSSVPIRASGGREANVTLLDGGRKAKVLINGIDYDFELREGQNFYFVMIKTEEGEKFVAKG